MAEMRWYEGSNREELTETIKFLKKLLEIPEDER